LGGLEQVITIRNRIFIRAKYRGCSIWMLAAFWGTMFQLGQMLSEDAAQGQMVARKNPW
jgi:hypothetical protein